MGWGKRQQRNARIVMQRTENREQGRPTYSGTGKKKRGRRGCPGLTLLAAGVGGHVWVGVEVGRWLPWVG